jgi:hypothetical protein
LRNALGDAARNPSSPMHQHYKDILDRIGELPKWFDERGVPRFGEFSPRDVNNIYAWEAALAEVSCQGCGCVFRVALTDAFAGRRSSLSDEIRLGRARYGDPPNIHCCDAGPVMSSVMHQILEYWSRDYEVSRDWQRDPIYEGPVEGPFFDPPDTVADVFDAVGSGAMAILVKCTSRRNRYDLAGRIAAAMATDGRILITYPENYRGVSRQMLRDLVRDTDVGWKDGCKVTLADFSRLKDVHLAMIERIMVLAAPSPRPLKAAVLNERGMAKREAEQKVWSDAATWLAAGAGDKVKIELALAHSYRMIAIPDVVIDAGRTDDFRETS